MEKEKKDEIIKLESIEIQKKSVCDSIKLNIICLGLLTIVGVITFMFGESTIGLMLIPVLIFIGVMIIIDYVDYRYWSTKYYMFKYFKEK